MNFALYKRDYKRYNYCQYNAGEIETVFLRKIC